MAFAIHVSLIGKSKRQPLTYPTLVSTQPLKLIHSDVWTSLVQSVIEWLQILCDDLYRSMITLDSLGSIHLLTNYKCLTILVSLNCLLKISFPLTSSNSNLMEEVNTPPCIFKHFLINMGSYIHKESCPYISQQGQIKRN